MSKKPFRFEFYSVHGHLETGPVNYLHLLSALVGLRGFDLQSGNHHMAVGLSRLENGQLFLVIYTGSSEKNTLFFDLDTKAELTEATLSTRFPARKTHALIDADKRLLVIETKKGNVSPFSLSLIIEEFAKTTTEFKALELSFNPIADEAFTVRLNEFKRIQAATITLARPNVDWTDQYNQLTEVAKESDARALDVTARSKRGKSLSKDNGLIQFIKSSASSAKSMFQKIKIVGSIGDDSGLIALDLNKHIQHLNLPLEVSSATGQPSDTDVRERLSASLKDIKSVDGDT